MNNNNRMLYSFILSGILILVGVKLIKTPTAKLVKYTGFGMTFAGLGLLMLEFRQNQKSIVDFPQKIGSSQKHQKTKILV